MKIFNLLFLLLFFANSYLFGGDSYRSSDGLGEETVKPIYYPSFALFGGANFFHGVKDFSHQDLNYVMKKPRFDMGLIVEAGILDNLNAGFMIDFNASDFTFMTPTNVLFNLFVKPQIPINDSLALFARLSGGLGLSKNPLSHGGRLEADNSSGKSFRNALDKTYKNTHARDPGFNFNIGSTIGVVYFPLSRLGFSLEGGARASYQVFIGEDMNFSFLDPPRKISGKTVKLLQYDLPVLFSIIGIL